MSVDLRRALPKPRLYHQDQTVTLYRGDALAVLQQLPDSSVDCCVTSPPYFGLRDYGIDGQLGAEDSPAEFVANLVAVFREVRRVLNPAGTLWLNLGDSYSGKANAGPTFDRHRGHTHKPGIIAPQRNMGAYAPYKSMLGIPWRTALAMVDDGWILRNELIWHKPNAMPESMPDRLAGRHEHMFLFTRSARYFFDLDSIREPHAAVSVSRSQPHRAQPGKSYREGAMYPGVDDRQTFRMDQMLHPLGRNPGDVWSIPTRPFPEAHFAAMTPELARRCVVAGCRPGGVVLDPFSGSGTTGAVATASGRSYVGVDINRNYLDLSLRTRLANGTLNFGAAQ